METRSITVLERAPYFLFEHHRLFSCTSSCPTGTTRVPSSRYCRGKGVHRSRAPGFHSRHTPDGRRGGPSGATPSLVKVRDIEVGYQEGSLGEHCLRRNYPSPVLCRGLHVPRPGDLHRFRVDKYTRGWTRPYFTVSPPSNRGRQSRTSDRPIRRHDDDSST